MVERPSFRGRVLQPGRTYVLSSTGEIHMGSASFPLTRSSALFNALPAAWVPLLMEGRRMKTVFGGDLAVVGSGCSSASGTTLSAPTKRTGGLPPPLEGSDARILAMLRRQLHGPKRVSLETDNFPAKLECQPPVCSYTADLVEGGDLSELRPLTELDQHCFDELAAISLAVATRAVPPGPAALRGTATLAGIRGIELVHRRLCDLLLDAAIAEVSPAELEAILR